MEATSDPFIPKEMIEMTDWIKFRITKITKEIPDIEEGSEIYLHSDDVKKLSEDENGKYIAMVKNGEIIKIYVTEVKNKPS